MYSFLDKIFSQKVENTKLYSTGNDTLDRLLTKAYCDGYADAQREFAEVPKSIENFFGKIGAKSKQKWDAIREKRGGLTNTNCKFTNNAE